MERGAARSLVLGDERGGGRFLRVTWHPESSLVVFSHWNGPVCTASTPVGLPDASRLIELLVVALRDLAGSATDFTPGTTPEWRRRIDSLVRRLRPATAEILRLLPERRDPGSAENSR